MDDLTKSGAQSSDFITVYFSVIVKFYSFRPYDEKCEAWGTLVSEA